MENIRPEGYMLENEMNDNAMSYHEMEYLMNKGKVNLSSDHEEIITPQKSPFESAYQNEIRGRINKVLATLTPKEADVIRYRFALNEEGKRYTLQETGNLIGKTREGVRQIEAKAIRKLKHPSKSKSLKEFLE